MADVQALCKRVIVIHHGRILFDGAARRPSPTSSRRRRRSASPSARARRTSRSTARSCAARTAGRCCASRGPTPRRSRPGCCSDLPVADLTIEDPPIEDVIEHVFASATRVAREARLPTGVEPRRPPPRPCRDASGPRPRDRGARLDRPLRDDHADRDRGAVPVPRRELLLHDRDDRRAGRSTSSSGRRSRTSRAARSAASRPASSPPTTSSGRWSGT